MKIVQFITKMDEMGGAQVHVKHLSMYLKKLGHEVTLLSGSETPIFSELQQSGVIYRKVPHLIRDIHVLKDIKALMEMKRILKEIQPDLLAVHSSKAGLLGRLAGWSLGIPTIFTAHGWAFTEGVPHKKRIFYSLLEKMAGIVSTGIITVSHYDYQLAIQKKIIALEKIKVIHNGVPDSTKLQQVSSNNKQIQLIMIARFSEPKDHRSLVDVLSTLETKDWNICFVGEGPLKKEIELEVKKRNLSNQVIFLGNRDDIPEMLARSQIFILTSDWEGLPLSVIEAMCSGLPVIASNVGGLEELVQDGKTGFLIEKGNKKMLREKITLLMENSELREQMGLSGRKSYIENFTFEKMVNETLAFYQTIINQKQN
ncbi:glycosyltransferase family 4 protein [Bacillus cereus]|uniref:glycosyltransferase family 4 protein n=1 Tax=Bacillus cereus TaxID=1396 RepID=UPI0015D4B089|nr:glycosyltransferase family 4 protein [Bacillus cereus]